MPLDNETFRKGIREDGTVEGYAVETHYLPCEGIGDDEGFMRVQIDAEGYDIETRVPYTALAGLGWVKAPPGLLERIKAAEQRIQDNCAPRRIPADPHGDVDLVLAEVRYLFEGNWPPFWIKDADGKQEDSNG